MPKKYAKLLQLMLDKPGWHFASDLKQAGIDRGLWGLWWSGWCGFIEVREVPWEGPMGKRTEHRATGKREADREASYQPSMV